MQLSPRSPRRCRCAPSHHSAQDPAFRHARSPAAVLRQRGHRQRAAPPPRQAPARPRPLVAFSQRAPPTAARPLRIDAHHGRARTWALLKAPGWRGSRSAPHKLSHPHHSPCTRPAATQHFWRAGCCTVTAGQESKMNYLRTAILLAGLTALFMGVGYLIGGASGAMIAFFVAAAMNFISYWNADRLVLSMHDAHEVDESTAPDLVHLVHELANRAGLPMPRVYLMENPQPNAFATGRNPEHAAVAATTGLLDMLSREELAGVIAHELAHIRNHDTLTMTITATIAGAISMLAQFGMFFGGGHRDNNSGLGVIG